MAKVKKPIQVTKESSTGLNQKFHDPNTGRDMNRGEFNKQIKQGKYPDYHIMHQNDPNTGRTREIPRSNPDKKTGNNLG